MSDPLEEIINKIKETVGPDGATLRVLNRDGGEHDGERNNVVHVSYFPDISDDGRTINLTKIGFCTELYPAIASMQLMEQLGLDKFFLTQPTLQELTLTNNILPFFISYKQVLKLGFAELVCTSKDGAPHFDLFNSKRLAGPLFRETHLTEKGLSFFAKAGIESFFDEFIEPKQIRLETPAPQTYAVNPFPVDEIIAGSRIMLQRVVPTPDRSLGAIVEEATNLRFQGWITKENITKDMITNEKP